MEVREPQTAQGNGEGGHHTGGKGRVLLPPGHKQALRTLAPSTTVGARTQGHDNSHVRLLRGAAADQEPPRSTASRRPHRRASQHGDVTNRANTGSPGPGSLRGRLCPGYFKLDTPESPRLSGISVACHGPGTADLALCILSLSPGHLSMLMIHKPWTKNSSAEFHSFNSCFQWQQPRHSLPQSAGHSHSKNMESNSESSKKCNRRGEANLQRGGPHEECVRDRAPGHGEVSRPEPQSADWGPQSRHTLGGHPGPARVAGRGEAG